LPILIQIHASEPVIKQRVAKRIDQMVFEELGLNEAFQVFSLHEQRGPLCFDKGILQAIGYKEYYALFQHL
jgi:tRNA A37 N6-isopentenylltransferase MiaA